MLRWLSSNKSILCCKAYFSCDQAALRTLLSVCLSVCPSVCHTLFIMFLLSNHHDIFRSYYQWQTWCPCKRSWSKVKVTEVMTPFSRFRTVTSVEFINDDEMVQKDRWCLEKAPYCFSRSYVKFQGHTTKTLVDFGPNWAFPDCNSSLNLPMAMKWCTKLEPA